MKNFCNRRKFLEYSIGLVATLALPRLTYGEQNRNHDIPKTIYDLHKLPEKNILARMIFGEGRGCPAIQEKILIGQSAINRMEDGEKYNGEKELREVLLKPNQYECFWPSNERTKENFLATLNPKEYDPKNWEQSLAIAEMLIKGGLGKLNKGQTIFTTKKQIKEWGEKETTPGWIKRATKIDTSVIQNSYLFQHEFYK